MQIKSGNDQMYTNKIYPFCIIPEKIPIFFVSIPKNSTFVVQKKEINTSQGQLPEWPNGADCNSAGLAFGGSNPSLPTFFAEIAQSIEH